MAESGSGTGDAAREARIKEHERFLKSIATSKHLPHLQSSTAGASGSTWKKIRDIQAQQRSKEEDLAMEREAAAASQAAKADLDARSSQLANAALKRKAKRDKKKKASSSSSQGAHPSVVAEEGQDSGQDSGAGD